MTIAKNYLVLNTNMVLNKLFSSLFLAIFSLLFFSSSVHAASYYVSPTGLDTNSGSTSSPFKTFSKGVSVMQAGDTLYLYGGTYSEKLSISKSGSSSAPLTVMPVAGQGVIIDQNWGADRGIDITGSYINISGIEVKNSKAASDAGICVNLRGQYIKVTNLTAHHCQGHGIYSEGKHIEIIDSTVYMSNMVNSGRNASSWGSGIKLKVGAEDTLIANNKVYNNYGEGIAATRSPNTIIRGNTVYDNFSVNIYVDNSSDVLVENNFSYCTPNSGFEKTSSNNRRAYAIALGEEFYSGWGAQLARVIIKNNISYNCYKSFAAFSSDVNGGGLDNVKIVNNTFWGSTSTAVSFDESGVSDQKGSVFANNIIQQGSGQLAWVENNAGITFTNNFWVPSVPSSSTGAVGTNDKSGGDVKFAAAPNYNPESFRLANDSPAINAGINLDYVTKDYFGSNRPYGGAYDIGAHEFGSQSVTPTQTPQVKLGDANSDNLVNEGDYSAWLTGFINKLTGLINGDFDANNKIDGVDYVIWLNNFGK